MNIKRGGTGLLLTELLIAVMFFSLASAICLRLFVAAHQSSERSAELSRAVIEAQNMAETFKAANGNIGRTAELLGIEPSYINSSGHLYLTFDANWDRDANSSDYAAILYPSGYTATSSYATVTVYKSTIVDGLQTDEELFSVDIAAVKAD